MEEAFLCAREPQQWKPSRRLSAFAPPFPRRLLHVLHTCISREEFREGAFGAVVLYSSPLRFSVVGRKLLKNQVTRADRCALVFRENVLEEFFFEHLRLAHPCPRNHTGDCTA